MDPAPSKSILIEGEEAAASHAWRTSSPGIITWLKRQSGGMLKTDTDAMYAVLAFIVLMFLFAGFTLMSSLPGADTPPPRQSSDYLL